MQLAFSNWTKIKTLSHQSNALVVYHQSNALKTNLLTDVHKWYQLCYCQGEKITFISLFTEAMGFYHIRVFILLRWNLGPATTKNSEQLKSQQSKTLWIMHFCRYMTIVCWLHHALFVSFLLILLCAWQRRNSNAFGNHHLCFSE